MSKLRSDYPSVIQAHHEALIPLMNKQVLVAFLTWSQAQRDPALQFDKHGKRPALVATATAVIVAHPEWLSDYFTAVPAHLPLLQPHQMPFVLPLNKRHLLTAFDYLTVGQTHKVYLYGRLVAVPSYSVLDVYVLAAMGETKRTALLAALHAQEQALPEYQQAHSEYLAQQRQKRLDLAEQKAAFDAALTNFTAKLAGYDPRDAALLTLAFWTQQLDTRIQYWQAHITAKHQPPQDFAAWRQDALRVFHQSRAAIVAESFWRPDQPDRIDAFLCATHWHQYLEETHHGMPMYRYYLANQAMIDACLDCQVTIHHDYFASYLTTISGAGTQFVFTTLSGEGAVLFGPADQYLKATHSPTQLPPAASGTEQTIITGFLTAMNTAHNVL